MPRMEMVGGEKIAIPVPLYYAVLHARARVRYNAAGREGSFLGARLMRRDAIDDEGLKEQTKEMEEIKRNENRLIRIRNINLVFFFDIGTYVFII